jgi:chlorobactene glucosyltransferase
MLQGLFVVALIAINAYFLAVALSNIVHFRLATKRPRITGGPSVSVIVPARNEERSIARCLDSLLKQDYSDYEIVVVDDGSSDGTAAIVRAIGARDPRVRLVAGAPLPDGWLGKPHALCQAAAVARGDILLLTDADTVHAIASVSWAVTNLQDHRADLLSGYIAQTYGTLGERIVVPTMYAMMLLVPLSLLPRVRSPRLAFAVGQYVVVRRDALEAVGGFGSIRSAIVDDMAMARRMKEHGFRNVFLDAKTAASCRLYSGYRDAFAGISRSVYSALGGNPGSTVAVAAVILGVIVGPAVSVVTAYAGGHAPDAGVALAALLFAAQWALVAWDRDVPFVAFLLYPLVFADLVVIMGASMLGTGFGAGVDWKGRPVRVSPTGAAPDAEAVGLAGKAGKAR